MDSNALSDFVFANVGRFNRKAINAIRFSFIKIFVQATGLMLKHSTCHYMNNKMHILLAFTMKMDFTKIPESRELRGKNNAKPSRGVLWVTFFSKNCSTY